MSSYESLNSKVKIELSKAKFSTNGELRKAPNGYLYLEVDDSIVFNGAKPLLSMEFKVKDNMYMKNAPRAHVSLLTGPEQKKVQIEVVNKVIDDYKDIPISF